MDNDVKKTSYFDLCTAICSAVYDETNAFERNAEVRLMTFAENHGHADWGCFYGPKCTDVTAEQIEYWIKRVSETSNPLLRMRYAGVVWDYCKMVTGKEPSYKDIKLTHIISSIETVEQDLLQHSISGIVYAEHAIEKSISIRKS